jgi:hypothetical protein
VPQNVNYAVQSALVYDFLKKRTGPSANLKAPRTAKNRQAANVAAERAAVLAIAD